MKKSDSFTNRLNQVMELKCLRAVDLVELTGLSKSRISQYINGLFEAKNHAIHLIAEALDVNVKWLLGYDVPMESDNAIKTGDENMNELQIFKNEEFGQIRTMTIDGEPWFVGKDVADLLGYSNHRDALSKRVDTEDRGVANCDTLGGSQSLTIINESGLYALILGSKLESAKKFKRWVTAEVLPSIRKTGAYIKDESLLTAKDQIKVMEIISKCPQYSLPYVLDLARPFLSDAVQGLAFAPQQQEAKADSTIMQFAHGKDVQNCPTNEVYSDYVLFCKQNDLVSVSQIGFSRQLCIALGLKIIDKKLNGQKRRIFIQDRMDR